MKWMGQKSTTTVLNCKEPKMTEESRAKNNVIVRSFFFFQQNQANTSMMLLWPWTKAHMWNMTHITAWLDWSRVLPICSKLRNMETILHWWLTTILPMYVYSYNISCNHDWLVDWVWSSRTEAGNICKQQGSCIPNHTYFRWPGTQTMELNPGHLRDAYLLSHRSDSTLS